MSIVQEKMYMDVDDVCVQFLVFLKRMPTI